MLYCVRLSNRLTLLVADSPFAGARRTLEPHISHLRFSICNFSVSLGGLSRRESPTQVKVGTFFDSNLYLANRPMHNILSEKLIRSS
jgi:hypothetical protein